jgi:hypothetical protein
MFLNKFKHIGISNYTVNLVQAIAFAANDTDSDVLILWKSQNIQSLITARRRRHSMPPAQPLTRPRACDHYTYRSVELVGA